MSKMDKITIITYWRTEYTTRGPTSEKGGTIDINDKVDIGKGGKSEAPPENIPGKPPVVKKDDKSAVPEQKGETAEKQTTEFKKETPGTPSGETTKAEGSSKSIGGAIKEGAKTILDAFKRDYSTIDIVPDDDSYKNISVEEGAKMLGYFTQKMEAKGFPWTVFKPGDGIFSAQKRTGEYEALMRLKEGKPVVLQLRRIIGLGLNPPKFKGKDITGKEAAGNMSFKTGGIEKNFGSGIRIDNLAELKFLYELYNPKAQIDMASAGEKTKAAKNLSYFAATSLGGSYPWKLYKPEKSVLHKIWSGIKTSTKAVLYASLVGAVASLMAGGLVSVATGAAIGAGLGIAKSIYNSKHGKEINPFEALYRLSKGDDVTFQEHKKHEFGISLPFPIGLTLGSLSFYLKHGKGSKLANFEELDLFHKMQNQEPAPKKK